MEGPIFLSIEIPELTRYLSEIDTSKSIGRLVARFDTPEERDKWLSHVTVAGLRMLGLYDEANKLFEEGKQKLIEQGEDPNRWGQVGLYYKPETKGEV